MSPTLKCTIINAYLFIMACNATTFSASDVLSATGEVEVSLSIDDSAQTVEITMTGPSDAYFSVGFGGTTMNNRYSIIASGTDTVTEHILSKQDSCQCNTGVSSTGFTVNSDTIKPMKGTRTVVLQRPITDATYTFPSDGSDLNVISAIGTSQNIEKHLSPQNRGSDVLTFQCCTNIAWQTKWKNKCPQQATQTKCERFTSPSGNRCQWIDCALVGECELDQSTGSGTQKACKKETNEIDCESKPNCNWVFTHAAENDNQLLFSGKTYVNNKQRSTYRIGVFILLGICVYLLYVWIFKKGAEKIIEDATDKSAYIPLLKNDGV